MKLPCNGLVLLAGLEKYAGQKVRKRASLPKHQLHNSVFSSTINSSTKILSNQ